MSGSPFISDNSIWSNAAVPGQGSRPHSPRMPGSISFAGVNGGGGGAAQAAMDRSDPARLPSHPLPSRPTQMHGQRTASALSFRSNASEDQTRSLDSQLPKPGPGAIGGNRVPSRELGSHLSRSNSLAASVNSFRSANSTSPSPSHMINAISNASDLGVPMSAGKHLFQRQNSTGGNATGSPTSNSHFFQQSANLSPNPGLHSTRDNNASGETEFGTPRLFLEGQHVFGGDDESIPPLDAPGEWSLGRKASLRSNSSTPAGPPGSKPRPKSWIQPQSSGPSLRPAGDRTSGQPQRADSGELIAGRAASVGAPSPKASLGFEEARSFEEMQGYPFPASAASPFAPAQRPVDMPMGGAGSIKASGNNAGQLTSSPTDSNDMALNVANLSLHNHGHQGRSSTPRGRASTGSPGPGIAGYAGAQGSTGGRGTPTLQLPRNMNLVGGLLSPTAATVGSMGPTPMMSPLGSPNFAQTSAFGARPEQQVAALGGPSGGSFDDQLRQSPFLAELMDRLGRVEAGMKDFSRQISGISRNVSLLLERTKALPPASLAGSNGAGGLAASGSAGASQDEIRALNSQIAALTSSVSHLLTLQGSGASGGGSMLAGLGIGSAPLLGTPHLGGPSSGIERAASPRVGAGPMGPHDVGRGLSPRPGPGARGWSVNSAGNKDGSEARWSKKDGNLPSGGNPGLGLGPGTPTLEDSSSRESAANPAPGTGFTLPNAIISKWEHLNLHPDLLRSIHKYGLGPPNKIQQRALPFLLRGSDIIAQAPPTQERIASYVIPALQLVLNAGRENAAGGMPPVLTGRHGAAPFPPPTRGPVALIVSTTVDQATQAQRMALGLGASLGIRVHIAAAGGIDVQQEAQTVVANWPHIVVGTPQKMSELFTYLTNNAASLASIASGGAPISTAEVRLVVLDEVDQLIARNLADHVSTLLRVLPQPSAPVSKVAAAAAITSPGLPPNSGGIFNFVDGAPANGQPGSLDRQVALFSNTVPQDVLNFAQSIHLRESVRVLVRRDGGAALPAGSSAGAGSVLAGAHIAPASSGFLPPRPGQGHGRDGTQPSNALGAHPVNSSINVLNDPVIAALKGLRQYYLYVAVTSNGGGGGLASPNPGTGPHAANEMKLDLITDLMEDIEYSQSVVYCANAMTLEAVLYKLASKGVEAVGLTREMNSYTRQQTLARFRSPTSQFGTGTMASTPSFSQPGGAGGARPKKVLVVCDMAVNPKDVHQIPLIVFYDMPRSVDDYKDKIACASAGAMARPSVCINVVTASGGPRGDVEMLRTLECHLGCKMAELPIDAKQILNF